MKKVKVLITGGTGLVGTHLSKLLINKGYEVAHLSRRKTGRTSFPTYYCNYKNNKIDEKAVCSANVIIHLAGANIAEKKWTKKRKKEILNSRVKTAELIFNTIKQQSNNLQLFISASAIGYYGAVSSSNIFVEENKAHNDFLGTVCRDWENAANLFNTADIRTVKIRTGLVLSYTKGALEKIKTSFKFGVRIVLGSGKQFMPWIHINDLCNIYIKAIEDNKMQGAYNAVSPEFTNYSEFTSVLQSMYKNVLFSVKIPAFFIRIMLGKMSSILLEGSKISANKIINSGFEFKYPNLQTALEDLHSLPCGKK